MKLIKKIHLKRFGNLDKNSIKLFSLLSLIREQQYSCLTLTSDHVPSDLRGVYVDGG